MELKRENLLELYYFLKLTRSLEDRIRIMYRQGKIVGGVYLSKGQEAIPVGASYALEREDIFAPFHRDTGALLVRGIKPKYILANYLGRKDSPTRGKDGNIHIGDLNYGIIGFVSMLADNIPVGVGIALSFRIKKEERVVMVSFGEGSTSRGDFHEGLNFAGIHRLPVVFVCNNNQYAYSTPQSLEMAIENVADRAKAYGFEGRVVDGNNVLEVYRAAKEAVDRARRGEGPTLIECKTFRMCGHSEHDDAFYVPKEKFEEWSRRDPLVIYEDYLQKRGILDGDTKKGIDERIDREINEAVEFAEGSPFPEPSETLEGVYA